METKTHNPSFTVSLRGYDREEVDEYLDSLVEALDKVDTAEEQARRMQAHIGRLTGRVKELEDRLRTETPKSGIALGERIGILLREAEDAAAETVTSAETEAARIRTAADERAAEAEEIVRSANARANEQARRTEAAARAEAAEILAEAEGRATARTRQIEQWAEQVISHTRAEEARMLNQQQQTREAFDAELKGLDKQRCAARRTLMELRDSLGRALTITDPPAETAAEGEPVAEPVGQTAGTSEASPSASASASAEGAVESQPAIDLSAQAETERSSEEGVDPEYRALGMLYGMAEPMVEPKADDQGPASDDRADDTGGMELRYSGVDDFEEKLEAWVNDGGEDDRRS